MKIEKIIEKTIVGFKVRQYKALTEFKKDVEQIAKGEMK